MKLKCDRFVFYSLGANLLVWIYFWISFSIYAEPYDPHPQGADFPMSPVTFWGYSMGLTTRVFDYPFGRLMLWIQLPSVLAVGLIMNLLFGQVTQEWTYAGIDVGGYTFIALMFVSFLQWYVVGRIFAWAAKKFRRSIVNHT